MTCRGLRATGCRLLRTEPRPGVPCGTFQHPVTLLPSGPDAVRRLKLQQVPDRGAVRKPSLYYTGTWVARIDALRQHFADDDGEEVDVE